MTFCKKIFKTLNISGRRNIKKKNKERILTNDLGKLVVQVPKLKSWPFFLQKRF